DLIVTGVQTCALPIYSSLPIKEVKIGDETYFVKALTARLRYFVYYGGFKNTSDAQLMLVACSLCDAEGNLLIAKVTPDEIIVTQIGRASCRERVVNVG